MRSASQTSISDVDSEKYKQIVEELQPNEKELFDLITSNSENKLSTAPTPFHFLPRLLARIPKCYREEITLKVCNFLVSASNNIDLTQCDEKGANLLSVAIYHNQFKLANTILEVATLKKQGTMVLQQAAADGYKPYHVLMEAWHIDFFIYSLNEVERLIEDQSPSPDDAFLDVLNLAIEFQQRQQTNNQYANKFTLEDNLRSLDKTLSHYQTFVAGYELACKIGAMLEDNEDAKKFKDYLAYYEILINAYSLYSPSQLYPCSHFAIVKRMYLAFRTAYPQSKSIINKFLEYIDRKENDALTYSFRATVGDDDDLRLLQKNLTATYADDLSMDLIILFLKHSIDQAIIHSAARDMRYHLASPPTRYAQQLKSFAETIACLKPLDSKIAVRLSNFHNIIANDNKSNEETKKTICCYFDTMARELISEKITKLPDANTMLNRLGVLLVGLPPMSPCLKAAVGALIGVLAGAFIGFGASATAPLLAGGILGGGLLVASACFFQGYKKTAEYRHKCEDKITEQLRTAVSQSSS